MQLWVIDIDGGEARQLTTLCTEAGNGVWSSDGKHIAFVSAVYPEHSTLGWREAEAANKKQLDEIAGRKSTARTFTRLFYRHWDSYVEDRRQHLFVLPVKRTEQGIETDGDVHDATPGDRDAYPTSSTFSSGEDFLLFSGRETLDFHCSTCETGIVEHQLRTLSSRYRQPIH